MAATNSENSKHEFSLTVVLRRSGEERWGFSWLSEGFFRSKERIVEKLMPGSVAWQWNQQHEDAGHSDQCIQPLDELISANGKTGREEMTAELAGREVVLEFRRALPAQEEDHAARTASGPWSTSQASTSPTGPLSSRRGSKPSFSASLTTYLQRSSLAVSPGATPSSGRTPPPTYAAWAEDEAENGLPAGESSNSQAPTQRQEASAPSTEQVETTLLEAPSRTLSDTPWGFVAQVMSLGGGSVRLSWVFDWEAAPAEFAALENVSRGFEVFQRSEASSEGQEVRVHSARPPLTLELPVGHRYSFEVRAIIWDSREETDEGNGIHGRRLWTSPAPPAVAADLRGSVRMAPAAPPTPVRGAVASRLGSFLARPQGPSASTSPVATASPAVTMGGSAGSSSRETHSDNPLASSKPRLVTAGPWDPAAEKRDISRRMLIRGGSQLVARQEMEKPGKLRGDSWDSDDSGSLQRLSTALSSLERTAKMGEAAAEAVPEEGQHSLRDRMEPMPAAQASVRATEVPSSTNRSRLHVQLADGQAALLEFSSSDDVSQLVADFVQQQRIRDFFQAPLLERVQEMVSTGKQEDTVDIAELV